MENDITEETEEKETMTAQEAEEFLNEMRKVFSIVRILDQKNFERDENHLNEHGGFPCKWYEFWKKNGFFENCISIKTFRDKKQRSKLEFLDSTIYQVISHYVEVDGEPCVIELISQLDEDALVDNDGRMHLLKKLTGYNKELYTDALTGTYNRRYYEDLSLIHI